MGFSALGFTPRPFNPSADQNFGGDVDIAGDLTVDGDVTTPGSLSVGTTATPGKLTIDSDGAVIRVRNATATRYRSDFSINSSGLAVVSYDDTAGGYLPLTFDFGDSLRFRRGAATALEIDASGLITVGNVDVGGDLIATTKTPASAGATGTAGTIAWDASYIYVCTATNAWKRAAIATW